MQVLQLVQLGSIHAAEHNKLFEVGQVCEQLQVYKVQCSILVEVHIGKHMGLQVPVQF